MNEPLTLTFQDFWTWLLAHPNCIVRAGTPDAVLYDDEDLHWHFAMEDAEHLLVQVLRGKRMVSEMWVLSEAVTYVQALQGEQEDEFLFELVAEDSAQRSVPYYFVMAHSFDGEASFTPGRVH